MEPESPPDNKTETWIAEHSIRIFLGVAAAMIIVAAVIVALLLDDRGRLVKVEKRTVGVEHAGPCRSEGIKDEECRRQARLIFEACSDQPVRCAELFGIEVRPWGDGNEAQGGGQRPEPTPEPSSEGGGAQNPSNPGQQPGPGSPGPDGGKGDNGPPAGPLAPPPLAPGPAAPEPGPPAETPGKGPAAHVEADGTSGAGVEVCATSKCVGVDLDVDPKGLLP